MGAKALYTYVGETNGGLTRDKQYKSFELHGHLHIVSDDGVIINAGGNMNFWRLDSLTVDGEVVYTYTAPADVDALKAQLAAAQAEVERLKAAGGSGGPDTAALRAQLAAAQAEVDRLKALGTPDVTALQAKLDTANQLHAADVVSLQAAQVEIDRLRALAGV